MAISLVTGGVVGGGAANGGNVTITLPTMLQNDVVILFGGHGTRGGSTVGPSTAGYTSIYNDLTNSPNFAIAYKIMGASPDTTVVGLGSGNAQDAAGYAVICLRGASATVVDATRTLAGPTTSTNPDCPSIVTQTDGAWVLALALSLVQDTAITAPAGYSNIVNGNATDNNPITAGGATKLVSSAGTEDPASFTNWLSGVWVSASVAIRPTTLPVTLTETASATDTPTAGTLLPVSLSEAGSATDTPSAGTLLPVTMSEAASAASTPSAVTLAAGSVSETASAADTPAATTLAAASLSEAASASDTPSATALLPVSASETAAAADTPSAVATLPVAISEAAAASDTPAATVQFPVSIIEAATASDTPAATASIAADVAETATADDAPSAGALIAANLTEAASAQDSPGAFDTIAASLSEPANASDSADATVITPTPPAPTPSHNEGGGSFSRKRRGRAPMVERSISPRRIPYVPEKKTKPIPPPPPRQPVVFVESVVESTRAGDAFTAAVQRSARIAEACAAADLCDASVLTALQQLSENDRRALILALVE